MWIDTGDGLVLKDDAGEEWARFGDPADHLNQRTWDSTPCVLVKDEGEAPDGHRPVRVPVLPPEGVDDSAWHTLVASDGALSPADEMKPHALPDDLDVPEGAVALLNLLRDRDDGGPVTVSEAHDLTFMS